MSNFTNDKQHKDKLGEMSGMSIEGQRDYFEYIVREKRYFY
jgi:hypothetical protein